MKHTDTERCPRTLTHRLVALQIALGKFVDHEPDAHQTVRHLALSILESARRNGSITVAQSAIEVLSAPQTDLEIAVQQLLCAIRKSLARTPAQATVLVVGGAPGLNECFVSNLATVNRRVVCAWTATKAREILRKDEVDFIILNLLLPDTDGRGFLTELRECPETATTPLFAVDEINAGEWIKNNGGLPEADDYAALPIVADVMMKQVMSLMRSAHHAVTLPRRDPLTGLLNHAALRKSYRQALDGCINGGEPLSLMLLTVTKDELTAFASPEWDAVMQQTSHALSRAMRATDMIALWGPDRFAILLPGVDLECARIVTDKISKRMASECPFPADGVPPNLRICAGVAEVLCEDKFDMTMERAAQCLLAAQLQVGGLVSDRLVLPAPLRRVLLLHRQRASRVLKQLLINLGTEVVAIENVPADFIPSPDMKRFHLVVIDEQLQEGGLDMLAALRSTQKYDRVPVLMLLARNSESNPIKAMELGATDYLTVPFPPDVFVSRVKRMLSRGLPASKSPTGICDVLIADDDAATLIVAATALYQHGGFSICLAKGAEDAIARFRAGRQGVVILDPLMKQKNKDEPLLEAILSESDEGETACIATIQPDCTAKSLHGIAARVKGLIQKPFNSLSLAREVGDLLHISLSKEHAPDSARQLKCEIGRLSVIGAYSLNGGNMAEGCVAAVAVENA